MNAEAAMGYPQDTQHDDEGMEMSQTSSLGEAQQRLHALILSEQEIAQRLSFLDDKRRVQERSNSDDEMSR